LQKHILVEGLKSQMKSASRETSRSPLFFGRQHRTKSFPSGNFPFFTSAAARNDGREKAQGGTFMYQLQCGELVNGDEFSSGLRR
jgi:hypothetical protein